MPSIDGSECANAGLESLPRIIAQGLWQPSSACRRCWYQVYVDRDAVDRQQRMRECRAGISAQNHRLGVHGAPPTVAAISPGIIASHRLWALVTEN
jgi:hypothetical protein